MFAIQSVCDEMLFRVEDVEQSIRIALLRSRVDYNLVVGSHAFQQIKQKWTHVRVDRKTLSLMSNLRLTSALRSHRKSQICGRIALHGAVDQRFVKIEDQRVFGSRRRLGGKKNALLQRGGEGVIGRKVFNNDNTIEIRTNSNHPRIKCALRLCFLLGFGCRSNQIGRGGLDFFLVM